MKLKLSEVRTVIREELARVMTEAIGKLDDAEAEALEKASGKPASEFRIIRVPPNDPPAAGGYNEGLLMAISSDRSKAFTYDFDHGTWYRSE